MKHIILTLAALCLTQCVNTIDPTSRQLTNADAGKVIDERYYEVNGRRKVDRRVIVNTKPRLETKIVTQWLD